MLSPCSVSLLTRSWVSTARAHHRRRNDRLSAIQARVKGGYSIVASMLLDGKPTLIVFRDPNGIRPCVIGERSDGSYIAASESVALDVLNFERSFEPQPGEAVFLRQGEAPIRRSLERKAAILASSSSFTSLARIRSCTGNRSMRCVAIWEQRWRIVLLKKASI